MLHSDIHRIIRNGFPRNKTAIMKIDIPKYDRGSGLQLCWSDDFTIKVTSENDEVVISANREGLISLANHLLNLAQTDVPCGTHIHLDENNSLEDGSQSIIIEKI